jgi:hypothetical protein
MTNSHSILFKQWTAGSAETSNEISDYAALPATYNLQDIDDVLDL